VYWMNYPKSHPFETFVESFAVIASPARTFVADFVVPPPPRAF
jgi:hypothetical protein